MNIIVFSGLLLVSSGAMNEVSNELSEHAQRLQQLRLQELAERTAALQAQQMQHQLSVAQAQHAIAELKTSGVRPEATPLTQLLWRGAVRSGTRMWGLVEWQGSALQLEFGVASPTGLKLEQRGREVWALFHDAQRLLTTWEY